MSHARSFEAPVRPCRQRGAALLTAMIIVTLVATLSAAMVWQQWRAVQVEGAERARAQSAWVLAGALDWARLILREDARSSGGAKLDHLGEPWAVPLAESRLSTFLAADKNATDDDGPEAFLSGAITDAQSRYNLLNLLKTGSAEIDPLQVAALARLCEAVSASPSAATRIANGLAGAQAVAASGAQPGSPLMPKSVDQLAWFGISPDDLRALTPYITILPAPTSVNVNTAPREVIMAAVKELDLGTAERIVQQRQRSPIRDIGNLQAVAPNIQFTDAKIGFSSDYFEVRGRLRLGDRVLEQLSLVQRMSNFDVVVIRRERISSRDQPAS